MKTSAPPVTAPKRGLAIVTIIAAAIMFGANALSILLPLNGKTQMQLSAQYDNMFTPAGFTFSVWGIIYLFYLGFTVYAAMVLLHKQHPATDKVTLAAPFFIGICLCNAAWLFAWHYEHVLLSVAIMVLYLLILITVHRSLRLALPWKPFPQKLWIDIPFSLNLGWICVATIANVAAWCVQNHWGYGIFSEATWAVIMIAIGSCIALLYVIKGSNIFVGLIIIWALFGVERKRQVAGGYEAGNVITATWIGMGLIFAGIVWLLVFKNKKNLQQPLFSQPQNGIYE